MHSLHSSKIAPRCFVFRGRLLDAHHTQNWATRTKLNIIAHAHRRRCRHSFAVYECAKARIRIVDRAATFAEMKLGMLARDHRPLLLRKEVMADSRVAPHQHDIAREPLLAMQLTAAILCEN